jgi:hypothetical protein
MSEGNVAIWTNIQEDDIKSAMPKMADLTNDSMVVSAEAVTNNINKFLDSFYPLLESQQSNNTSFFIDEIELSLVVNAKGGIELLGKLEAGAQASVKVKLKKKID